MTLTSSQSDELLKQLTLPEILIREHQDSLLYDTQQGQGCQESAISLPVTKKKQNLKKEFRFTINRPTFTHSVLCCII